MRSLFDALCDIPSLQPMLVEITKARSLSQIVLMTLRLVCSLSCIIAQQELERRAKLPTPWPRCPKCGVRLQSKGLRPRKIFTLLGVIRWKRRVGRCPNKCHIGQVVPLDEALGLAPYQETSTEVKKLSCALAVFVPFEIAAKLLEMLSGTRVCAGSIWQWVQEAGQREMQKIEQELHMPAEDGMVEEEPLDPSMARMTLLIGADGVMAPFRPNVGTPKGKTVWREVKVGILVRFGRRITRKGKEVPYILRRRVAAVLGTADDFSPRMVLEAKRQGLLLAPKVIWLSDGGRWLWKLFSEHFEQHAMGILDFYHAAQNLWKGITACLDGRTKKARTWFVTLRHSLRHDDPDGVLDHLQRALDLEGLPKSAAKTLGNLYAYLEKHREHINYAEYKALGLPIGSGLVESACKWLIQQRFKGVGMRWSEDGFNHLLHLRLAWVNSRFDEVFK